MDDKINADQELRYCKLPFCVRWMLIALTGRGEENSLLRSSDIERVISFYGFPNRPQSEEKIPVKPTRLVMQGFSIIIMSMAMFLCCDSPLALCLLLLRHHCMHDVMSQPPHHAITA
eukprot:scpid20734/ scgid2198/ 